MSFDGFRQANAIGQSNPAAVASRTAGLAGMIRGNLDPYHFGPVEFPNQHNLYRADPTKFRGPRTAAGAPIYTPLPEKIRLVGPEAEETFHFKRQLSDNIGAGGMVPFGEPDIAFLKAREAEQEVQMFHQWLHGFINYREPGKLAWLNKIYPGFFQGKIEQIKDDYATQWRVDFLKHFGVHTFEDLLFAYGRHRGDIMTKSERETHRAAINAMDGFQFGHWAPKFGKHKWANTRAIGTNENHRMARGIDVFGNTLTFETGNSRIMGDAGIFSDAVINAVPPQVGNNAVGQAVNQRVAHIAANVNGDAL